MALYRPGDQRRGEIENFAQGNKDGVQPGLGVGHGQEAVPCDLDAAQLEGSGCSQLPPAPPPLDDRAGSSSATEKWLSCHIASWIL